MSETFPCPKCGTSLSTGAGFGMVSCTQCGEIILLDQATMQRAVPLPEVPEVPEVSPENPAPEANSDFQDVVDFGNQELPPTSTGVLLYDVKISGIDTLELREAVAECLRDKKLGLDPHFVLSQIKEGILVLNQLHPVRATLLLSRLKYLPFKITWTSQQLVKSTKMIAALLAGLLLSRAAPVLASEWGRHEVNLKGYIAKMNNGQEEIEALIKKKNENKDPKVRDEILKEINKKNEELRKVYKDFRSEEEHVRFEHPEQGDKTIRKYRHFKLKSIEELENESSLDGQLTRLKIKAEKTYPKSE